jgi:hypothetical protein
MGDRSHASATKHDGLQIDDDLRFQRRTWRIQRIGWIAFALLVLAGLLGVFGSGPLSRAEATGEGVRIEYDRFARLQSSATLRITIDPAAVRDGAIRLVLAGDYIHNAQIQYSTLPVHGIASDGIVLGAEVGGGALSLIAAVHLTFERAGAMRARIGLVGRRPAELTHWVYP